jgi:hypothetical protein
MGKLLRCSEVSLPLLLILAGPLMSVVVGAAPAPVAGDQVLPDPATDTVLVGFVGVKKQPARVGQIFIVGDESTGGAILEDVPLCTGAIITPSALRQAEKNLADLGIFQVSADGSIRPTVAVMKSEVDVDEPNFALREILITVKELPAEQRTFMHWIYSVDSGMTGILLRTAFRCWKEWKLTQT